MSASQPSQPVSPLLRAKRALDYWHRTGKFPFDQPGYDRATGLVSKQPKHTVTLSQVLEHTVTEHRRTPTPGVLSLNNKTSDYDDGDEGSDSTSPRAPYAMNPLVESEREERLAARVGKDYSRWQSAYRELIGPTPVLVRGDRDKAQVFWYRICQAIDRGGWTPAESERLRLMERKWGKRARGEDVRFNVMGTRGGGMDEREKREYRDWQTMREAFKNVKESR